ncbi:hypothetical protein N7478_007015 [Penicillium angulare]|uniref:uncharacterized protein n=1 Tax=Penicillium angulare TaxID=116970 RepID=UPI0025407B07|nr:uncharacterized protein N7478_007015 [Penicillium angulare]KAJ5281643.1 hypothetical protein N7478_007015 [Penicillium angulare]
MSDDSQAEIQQAISGAGDRGPGGIGQYYRRSIFYASGSSSLTIVLSLFMDREKLFVQGPKKDAEMAPDIPVQEVGCPASPEMTEE